MERLDKFLETQTVNLPKLAGFLLIALGVFIDLVYFDFLSLYVLAGALVLYISYLFKEKIWSLLILTPPSLLLGSFLHFPVTPTWVYEAYLAEVFVVVLSMVLILEKVFDSDSLKLKEDWVLGGLSTYLLLSLLSYFEIVDFRLFIYGLKLVVIFLLTYLVSLNYLTNQTRLKYFLYSLAFTSLAVTAQIFYKFYEVGLSLDFFLNRNDILISLGPIATSVAVLVMILPAILGLYFWEKGKIKPFILIIFFLGALAVFLSLGKAAVVSLFLALFYIFWKYKQKRIVFGLVFSVFVLLAFTFLHSFFEGLVFRVGRIFVDVSSQFRLQELKVCFDLIQDNFWTGVGTGQQIIYYSRQLFPGYEQLVNNFFLQSFIDLGVLGLGLAIFIFSAIFKKVRLIGKKVGKYNQPLFWGLTASLIAVFINGQVEVTLFALPYGIIFWLLVGSLEALKNK